MKSIRSYLLLAALLSLLIYIAVFSIRSPFKDYFYPIVYKNILKEMSTKVGDLNNTHIVYLRNGKKLKGNILRETENEYYFRGSFGSSGYIEQVLKKKEIKRIDQMTIKDAPIEANEIIAKKLFPDFYIFRRDKYTFVSNENYLFIERMVELLEALRADIVKNFPEFTRGEERSNRICVVIFKDEGEYVRFVRSVNSLFEDAVGFYHPDYRMLFTYNMSSSKLKRDSTNETIRHEGAHQIFYANGLHVGFFIDRLWLVEGLALYCEPHKVGFRTYKREENMRKIIESDDFIPLRELVKKRSQIGHTDIDKELRFYDESWALVYFLMNEYRPQFGEYLTEIKEHPFMCLYQGDVSLLEKSLGMTIDDLEAEFKRFWGSKNKVNM